MGKAEFGTAKYQSKQLKAAGLQRLRFYCQICEKQCRDQNGFKNHLQSPSHLGRISNLSKDGKGRSVIEDYLRLFEREFLRLLRINHGTKKINANKFYQEYILSDKNHVHMNATRWSTLTSFVRYLGRTSKVRVETPDDATDEFDLVISLVDPRTVHNKQTREKELVSDDNRSNQFLQLQIAKGKELNSATLDKPPTELHSNPVSNKPINLSLKGLSTNKKVTPAAFGGDDHSEDEQ